MTNDEARELLIQLNQWRRDDHVPNSYEMPNPKDIGIAIDVAIDQLGKIDNNTNVAVTYGCLEAKHET